MPTLTTLLLFGAATLAILVVPGPSVVYVVARSVEHGRTAGLYSMVGLESGATVHVVAAALGLGTLLASSGTAFTVVRWAGAGYLVYLGVRQLRQHRFAAAAPVAAVRPGPPSRLRLVRDGALVDLLNPKTALFFVAFLPQFVDPGRGPGAVQVLVLGLCFVALAVVCDGCYAVVAGRVAARLRGSALAQRRINRTTGCVYLGLAGMAAFT